MTLCRHASPRAPSKRGKGQRSTPAVPFLFTPPAPSVQGRARAHDIAPSHLVPPTPSGRGRVGNDVGRFADAPRLSKQGRAQPQDIVSPRLTPPAPSKRGRGNVQRRRVIPFHPARSIRTERCMRTRHCAVSLNPTRFIEVGKGSVHRLSSRQALPRLRYLCRKGRVHMMLSLTLQHTAPFVRAGQCSPAVAPSYVTSSASSARGRAWLAPPPGTFKARVFCAGFAKTLFNFSPGVRLPHPVKIISIIGRSNLV